MRKKFNNIFSSRAFYIVFSLLASIAIWMFVEYSVNEEQRLPVYNIPVVYRNVEILRDRRLLISSTNPQSVNLTFYVPRSLTTKLQTSTLSVEVDLAGITSAGITYLPYNIIYPAGVSASSVNNVVRSVSNIALIIDRLQTVTVDVKVDYSGGTASEDLIADRPEFSPQTITVSGPNEVVSQISEARVTVFRENLASTLTDTFDFVLLDDNKKEFDHDTLALLETSHESINVKIPVKQMKDITLTVDFTYGAGSSEQNTSWDIKPPYITVTGDPEVLRDFNSINLGVIDTVLRRDMTFDVTRTIGIPNYVEDASGIREAKITVYIQGLNTVDFSTTNLQWINALADHRVEWITQSLVVTIRGKPDDLARVSLDNIRIVADLRDIISAGSYQIQPTVYVDGISADVGAVGEYRVSLRLLKEEEE